MRLFVSTGEKDPVCDHGGHRDATPAEVIRAGRDLGMLVIPTPWPEWAKGMPAAFDNAIRLLEWLWAHQQLAGKDDGA